MFLRYVIYPYLSFFISVYTVILSCRSISFNRNDNTSEFLNFSIFSVLYNSMYNCFIRKRPAIGRAEQKESGTLCKDARHASVLLYTIYMFPEPACPMGQAALTRHLTFRRLDDGPKGTPDTYEDQVHWPLPFLSWNRSSCWRLPRRTYR